jgi:AcrR family transcriptional regulator
MLSERQTEIINKSIDIIATKGIQGLTIKNLSKEIGISEPAIYRHFESKTDILLTILKNFEEVTAFMNEAMKQDKGSAIGKIEFMFSKIIEIFSLEPSHISVIFSEEVFRNEKVLKDKIVEVMNLKLRAIEEIIKEGQEKGAIRTEIDNETLALIVVGSLRFMVKQWDLQEKYDNLQPEGDKLITGLKNILKK